MEKMIPTVDRKVSRMVRLRWTAKTSSLTLTPSYGTPTVHTIQINCTVTGECLENLKDRL